MNRSEQGHRAKLHRAVTDLHLRAGRPSTRSIARTSGMLSHDTVHRILTEDQTPTWTSLESVVAALGGNVEDFRVLWLAARTELDTAAEQSGNTSIQGSSRPSEGSRAHDFAPPSAPGSVR